MVQSTRDRVDLLLAMGEEKVIGWRRGTDIMITNPVSENIFGSEPLPDISSHTFRAGDETARTMTVPVSASIPLSLYYCPTESPDNMLVMDTNKLAFYRALEELPDRLSLNFYTELRNIYNSGGANYEPFAEYLGNYFRPDKRGVLRWLRLGLSLEELSKYTVQDEQGIPRINLEDSRVTQAFMLRIYERIDELIPQLEANLLQKNRHRQGLNF